jgi:tetratricopeptide (TPR) repeat protein
LLRKRNIPFATLLLLVFACSPTKDKWLNRKFHTLTGHYNVYFNGEQKLLDAIKQIEGSHPDDFSQTLSVIRTGTPEAAKTAGNILDEALKKFSATIQMHQIGSYTDDAYFAIAKTRYYKQDYYTAIETFQFILGKYKDGPFTHLSTCWIAKCYLGLNKLQEAEAIMGQLMQVKTFAKKDIGFIYANAADIDLRTNKPAQAIDHLKLALKGKLSKDEKIRYHYILGQLCLEQKKFPEATLHFNKVIKFVPPYDYAFNATLALLKVYDLKDPKSVAKVKRNLRKMARDEKNLDYYDQIWFEMGKINMAINKEEEAIADFKKAAALSTKNRTQKGLAFHEVAKVYFKRKDYKNAQAYYDSTVLTLDPKYKDFTAIKNTKVTLGDLINNLVAYETQDSLQKLALLSNDELNRRVDAWMAEYNKRKLLEEKEAKKKAKAQASVAGNAANMLPAAPTIGSGSGEWYFYNTSLMSSGAAEFFSNKKWGPRKNEDFWRIAAKEKTQETADTAAAANNKEPKKDNTPGNDGNTGEQTEATQSITGNKEKDAWIKNVPFSSSQKEKSNAKMLDALHNLNVMYYDNLSNWDESITYGEKLQDRFPFSEYEDATFYYLFKAYSDKKNTSKAEAYKQKLISQFPNSNYALLAQNKKPINVEAESNKQLLEAYAQMYEAYKTGNCEAVFTQKVNLDKNWPENKLKSKYDLLEALCIGKTKDRAAFEKALANVAAVHKGTEAANTADEYIKALKREAKKAAFVGKDTNTEIQFDLETETPFYYVLAIKTVGIDVNEFNLQINGYNDAYASDKGLRVNAYVSNEGYQLFVVREFSNFKQANEYLNGMKLTDFKNKKLKLTQDYIEYVISGVNFKKVLKDKKVAEFEAFFKKQLQQIPDKK